MVKRLGHEIEEVEAERTGCLAEVRQRRDVGSRMEQLAKSGATSHIRSAEALANQEAASTKCEMADARLSRLRAELGSAQNGVFLRDGTNDVPYSQQQRDRLFLRRQELETDILQETSRAAQLAAEVTEERSRLDRVGHYDVTLPADYVVWSVAASPGSAVTEGQVVLDLANCQSRFLAVELPEREFERIKPGDPAAIRLIGSDEWGKGQVRQVRGSAARGDDRLFAAQLPNPTSGQIAVEIGLSADAVPADRSNFCDIGRLAEVRFARPRPAIVGTLTSALRWVADRLKTAEHTSGASD
jgi:multidrug resistance efflux pump